MNTGCMNISSWSCFDLALISFDAYIFQFSSVSQLCLTLQPHRLQHARPPCPSSTPGTYPNSCPLSQQCHPTISSSVISCSSCPQSFPASESFQMSQLFASGGQSIGVSASTSVLPMNSQDWSPLGWTGWISLQPKGLSRVFSRLQSGESEEAASGSRSHSHCSTLSSIDTALGQVRARWALGDSVPRGGKIIKHGQRRS